jgi:hypothetical protein
MKLIDGQPVANAATELRLEVTAADIREGAPGNPNACAIAVAAVRQLAGVDAAKVHLGVIYLRRRGKWFRWKTPEYATREIVAFDRGGRFIPCEIDLKPVSVATLTRRVAKIRGTATTKTRAGKARRLHYTEGVRDSALKNDPPAKG